MKLKLPNPREAASVSANVYGHPGSADVVLDLTDSTYGYRSRHTGLVSVFSNVTPADARQLALALLREAARAEGRPLPAPADAVVSREWREVSRALREEAAR